LQCGPRRDANIRRTSVHSERTASARYANRTGDAPGGEAELQVPAHVEYERATSVAHALALLSRYTPGARILAGGHSLIPMMKLRLAQPEVLIDINAVTGLR